mgnify:CR=1 FL=1
MDLDFLLITTIYLLVILTIHYHLKESEKNIPVKQVLIKKVPKLEEDENINNQYNKYIDENKIELQLNEDDLNDYRKTLENEVDITDNELIIDNREINNMDDTNRGLLQYLDVEADDTIDSLQLLTKNLDTDNTINILNNDTKSDLDKFFTSVKDNEFSFPPVPTKDKKISNTKIDLDYRKNNLMEDIKKLNDDNLYGSVYAFDEFNSGYSNI